MATRAWSFGCRVHACTHTDLHGSVVTWMAWIHGSVDALIQLESLEDAVQAAACRTSTSRASPFEKRIAVRQAPGFRSPLLKILNLRLNPVVASNLASHHANHSVPLHAAAHGLACGCNSPWPELTDVTLIRWPAVHNQVFRPPTIPRECRIHLLRASYALHIPYTTILKSLSAHATARPRISNLPI